MHPTILSTLFEISPTPVAMCSAGIAVFLVAVFASKNEIAQARGLDKIVALSNLCFAVPLAAFGAEHLSAARSIMLGVPSYMPGRLFWAYFVGFALLSASLSIATKIALHWSSLLFGIMMFLFVAMIHFPRAIHSHYDRLIWTIVFREMSFGAAGLILAATAMDKSPGNAKSTLTIVGSILIAITGVVFGVVHFLHPLGLPGVPLEKQMPMWVPGRVLIDYATGATLLVAAGSILLRKKTRIVAACLGAWLLITVLAIYGPVLIAGLSDPSTGVKVVAINYFCDTLLFAGVFLVLARAMPRSD